MAYGIYRRGDTFGPRIHFTLQRHLANLLMLNFLTNNAHTRPFFQWFSLTVISCIWCNTLFLPGGICLMLLLSVVIKFICGSSMFGRPIGYVSSVKILCLVQWKRSRHTRLMYIELFLKSRWILLPKQTIYFSGPECRASSRLSRWSRVW